MPTRPKRRILCLCLVVLAVALPFVQSPAAAQEIPIINHSSTYWFYDAVAGYADASMLPLKAAAFDLTFRMARTLVNWPGITFPVVMDAWVAKTVQISQSGSYRFTMWGHYAAIVSACFADAWVTFRTRVVDASTNTILADPVVGGYATGGCFGAGGSTDFSWYVDVSIPSERVNHQFYIEAFSESYGLGFGGTAIADAWNQPNWRGISYSSIKIEPTPGGGGGGCVVAGTSILTDSGYVMIEDLKKGDTVLGYDFANQTVIPVHVLSVSKSWVDSVLSINNGTLVVTLYDQPIYIKNETYTGWLRDPVRLTVHDSLFDPVNNVWVPVNTWGTSGNRVRAFDLEVEGPNNFIANGFLLDRK